MPLAHPVPADALTPVAVEGELRIQDTDLAVRLGFGNPVDIRKLIRRYADDLARMGVLATVAKTSGAQGGRPGEAFFLNRRQAIFVTAKSATPAATDTTIEVIHRFDAYEQGEAVPLTAKQTGGIVRSVVRAAIAEVRGDIDALLSGYDPTHAVVTEFEPMLDILAGQGVAPKGRRPLVQRCSRLCMRWLVGQGRGADIRVSRETQRFLFRVTAAQDWLAAQGNALVADHKARIAGQGVMQFRPRPTLLPLAGPSDPA